MQNKRTLVNKDLFIRAAILMTPCIFITGCLMPDQTKLPSGPEYYQNSKVKLIGETLYAGLGNYSVESMELPNLNESVWRHKVWYPSDLQRKSGTYPIVVLANGSGTTYSMYEATFRHLASWGFVVIGNNDMHSWSGKSATESLNLLISANKNVSSVLYQRLDLNNIGMAGGSQGGVGAVNAVTNSTASVRFASLFTASMPGLQLSENLKWSYKIGKVEVPTFMVSSTGKFDSGGISPLSALEDNAQGMGVSVPVITARRKNVDHEEMWTAVDGYMTAWFAWTLKKDKRAEKIFKGPNSELEHNPNWQNVTSKNI